MILWLIKSSLLLLIGLGFYHGLLERMSNHHFKRFFLISSLLVAFLIPFIPIPAIEHKLPGIPLEKVVLPEMLPAAKLSNDDSKPQALTLSQLAVPVYLMICSFCIVRFLFSLYSTLKLNVKYTVSSYKKAQLVLVDEHINPYAFLHKIFVPKTAFIDGDIPDEILEHEYAHIKQRHSLDILFIEMLKIFLWFHPLLNYYKRAIQLNHEFLADREVLRHYGNHYAYQQHLLSFASIIPATPMMSHSSFRLTQKRLKMMNKQSSKARISLIHGLMIPYGLLLIWAFGFRPSSVKAQEMAKDSIKTLIEIPDQALQKEKERKDRIFKGVRFGKKNEDGEMVYRSYEEMTEEEKAALPSPPPPPNPKSPSVDLLKEWESNPQKYGVWLDGKRIKNANLQAYKSADFSYYSSSRLMKNALNYGKHEFQVDIQTHDYFQRWISKYK